MSSDVTFGVTVPQWEERTPPDVFEEIAVTAEEAGFDVLWKGEHITFPSDSPTDRLPYIGPTSEVAELFSVLSFLAGVTTDIHVGSNVCIVPYRHPVVLAKSVLTLDVLSDGRFEFGAAVGWLRQEFEVLDVPFEERGGRTTEFFELYERVVEEGEVRFDGPYHSFQSTGFYPRPVSDGGPPVWIGGESDAALDRLGRFGDGWTVVGKTPREIEEERDRVQRAWTASGRSGRPDIAVMRTMHVGTDSERDADGALTGSADSIVTEFERYVDAGVTHLNVMQPGTSPEERVEQIERFGEEILPRF